MNPCLSLLKGNIMKIEDMEKVAAGIAIIGGILTATYYGFKIRMTIKEIKKLDV